MIKVASKKMDVDMAEEARRLRREGETVAALAARYRMTVGCMTDVLKDRMHRRLVQVELTTEQWDALNEVARSMRAPRESAALEIVARALRTAAAE